MSEGRRHVLVMLRSRADAQEFERLMSPEGIRKHGVLEQRGYINEVFSTLREPSFVFDVFYPRDGGPWDNLQIVFEAKARFPGAHLYCCNVGNPSIEHDVEVSSVDRLAGAIRTIMEQVRFVYRPPPGAVAVARPREEPPVEKPSLLIVCYSQEQFDQHVREFFPAILVEVVQRNMFRAHIQPMHTIDDYIWGACPDGHTRAAGAELLEKARDWVEHKGDYAHAIALMGSTPGPAHPRLHMCANQVDVALWIGRILDIAPQIRRGNHVPVPAPPPPPREVVAVEVNQEDADLSHYDPDDRAAIQAAMGQDPYEYRERRVVVQGNRPLVMHDEMLQWVRGISPPRQQQQRERNPFGAIGGDPMVERLRQNVSQAAARRARGDDVPVVPGGGIPSGPRLVPERQGIAAGRPQNSRLRERVDAAASARAARQLVEAPDVQRMIAPRLQKSNDKDAMPLTVDDNTCTVCMESHITTMLFPCLHYVFCAGCIEAWKDNGHTECPLCRIKIELVLQPRGKVSLEELAARSSAKEPVLKQAKIEFPPVALGSGPSVSASAPNAPAPNAPAAPAPNVPAAPAPNVPATNKAKKERKKPAPRKSAAGKAAAKRQKAAQKK